MINNKYKVNYYSTIKNLKDKEKRVIQQVLKNQEDVEFLFSIIIMEKMNRGKMFWLEKALFVFCPKIISSLDFSIGICQIKPSTAKQVLSFKDSQILRFLINPESNILIMCKLINCYSEKLSTKVEVLNYYLTGKNKPFMNNELKIYHQLMTWSSLNQFYLKLIQNIA